MKNCTNIGCEFAANSWTSKGFPANMSNLALEVWTSVYISVPKGGYFVYYPSNNLQHYITNVYEQLTIHCAECSLFSVH